MEDGAAMAFEDELVNLITRVPDLARRNNNKFDHVEEYIKQRLAIVVSIAYLSNVKKQFVARVGQTLVRTPDVILLLASGGAWDPYLERLKEIAEYASGLDAFVLLSEEEGVWQPRFVVATKSSAMRAKLKSLLPSAAVFPK